MTSHKLMMLVRNKPGVLARVVVLFSTRGVEVESLSFDPVGHDDLSRVDVVVGLREERAVDQLVKQLSRLVDVVRVVDVEPAATIERIGA
ncbi:acetolactate synthase small subunit [Nocardia sp. NRRL S-836]|uniref:acetolactate synthase small subunit n=1 Tax=Nocardia sp. NRRL S-836 TaxID=1519492 RepID=UPI0018D1E690|nr:acetolactate synthase small subunit [Nocardia sp. NRRL S-836]